jgi:hypothetical protein
VRFTETRTCAAESCVAGSGDNACSVDVCCPVLNVRDTRLAQQIVLPQEASLPSDTRDALQDSRRKASAVTMATMREAVLLHLFMESALSNQVSMCPRCLEWTEQVGRTFSHPLPALLVVANHEGRAPKYQWGEETLWLGHVDYHLAAVAYLKPGFHYILTCRFKFQEFSMDPTSFAEANAPWFLFDDTVDHGRFHRNPNGSSLPDSARCRGYHARAWYFVTRTPEGSRYLSDEVVAGIRSEISNQDNYEMIFQESVQGSATSRRKHRRVPKGRAPAKAQPTYTTISSGDDEEAARPKKATTTPRGARKQGTRRRPTAPPSPSGSGSDENSDKTNIFRHNRPPRTGRGERYPSV